MEFEFRDQDGRAKDFEPVVVDVFDHIHFFEVVFLIEVGFEVDDGEHEWYLNYDSRW